jgi:hypothetical protein
VQTIAINTLINVTAYEFAQHLIVEIRYGMYSARKHIEISSIVEYDAGRGGIFSFIEIRDLNMVTILPSIGLFPISRLTQN